MKGLRRTAATALLGFVVALGVTQPPTAGAAPSPGPPASAGPSLAAPAAPAAPPVAAEFNGRHYGAVGNGYTNDTAAILLFQTVNGYCVANSANTGGGALRLSQTGSSQNCAS